MLPCAVGGNPQDDISLTWSLVDNRNNSRVLSSIDSVNVGEIEFNNCKEIFPTVFSRTSSSADPSTEVPNTFSR